MVRYVERNNLAHIYDLEKKEYDFGELGRKEVTDRLL